MLPILIGGHGTTGLADECAPSHQVDHPYLDSLAVAWAATGLPIIAPDYAGLGTVGVQGYANHPDTGRSMLDAARALRNLLGSERLSDKAVFFGHSQGGGAALAGGAYATERPDIHVAGIIPFAPAWAADITYVEAIKISSLSITSLRALLATVLYADMANVTDDESHAGDAFAPSLRDHFVQSTKTLCYNKLGPALNEPSSGYVPPNTLGELLDPAFVTAALDCADNGACDGLPGQWVQRSKASDPHVDPSVPILYLQGGKDETAKPTQASCFYNRLVEDGASPIDCVYPDDDHSSILPNATGFAIEWAMATANGEPPPECPAERGLPNCSLF